MSELGDETLRTALLVLMQEIQAQLPPPEDVDNIPPQAMWDVLAMIRTLALAVEALLDPLAELDKPAGYWLMAQMAQQNTRETNGHAFQIPEAEALNMR